MGTLRLAAAILIKDRAACRRSYGAAQSLVGNVIPNCANSPDFPDH
jgi:hypothetical protein